MQVGWCYLCGLHVKHGFTTDVVKGTCWFFCFGVFLGGGGCLFVCFLLLLLFVCLFVCFVCLVFVLASAFELSVITFHVV